MGDLTIKLYRLMQVWISVLNSSPDGMESGMNPQNTRRDNAKVYSFMFGYSCALVMSVSQRSILHCTFDTDHRI